MSREPGEFTIATVVLAGVLLVFIIPTLSHILLTGFGYMLYPLSATCSEILQLTCNTETRTVNTTYGTVSVNITKIPEVTIVARMANYAQELLLAILIIFTRVEVMATAFAIDLIISTYEGE